MITLTARCLFQPFTEHFENLAICPNIKKAAYFVPFQLLANDVFVLPPSRCFAKYLVPKYKVLFPGTLGPAAKWLCVPFLKVKQDKASDMADVGAPPARTAEVYIPL